MKNQAKYQLISLIRARLEMTSSDDPCSATDLVKLIQQERDKKYRSPEIRDLISFIRSAGLIQGICANHGGYYLAKNSEEILEYQNRLAKRLLQIGTIFDQLTKDKEDFQKKELSDNS